MYPCIKFLFNLENFRFGDQICPKNVNDKNFEKINIKTEISI